jgi:hypothetical protein
MISIDKANEYFYSHVEANTWISLDEEIKSDLIHKAETMIDNFVDLRKGTKELDIYQFAVFEQAIFLVTFDKERSRLQKEGVTSYKVDDLSFTMESMPMSPIAVAFLKKYTYKRLGEIV